MAGITACWCVAAGFVDGGLTRYTITGYAQGTDYMVTYYATDSSVTKAAVDSILAAIDSSMSLYNPYSLINEINGSEDGTFDVDEHFYKVLARSFEIHHDSEGIFDITVAPLVQLWGFGPTAITKFPDSTEVNQALACVGMDKIRLLGGKLEKQCLCVQLDVNGIAQGYSVDVLADHLESKGIVQYLVELGGELRVKGPKPDGTPMRIGIERPSGKGMEQVVIEDVMEVREGAVTTAGSYRKFLQDSERRVSHHINPKTGYPFDTEIISATIYAKNAVTADGYDNVIMAMKADEAVAFVNQREDLDVLVVYRDASGFVRDTSSAGFNRLLSSY
ncbi:FAD:protein FMN transferase [Parapedobacter sp. ISTM3]|uniref:FAD:protein FMN transferase n=1 Tax=Parapedobacter luteus TaxID=623280 RepID=A0A1T5F0H6_9SPHI|nr:MULTISPECIES: FAD:protein FMN transferase [Parapedobacter]MBK1439305.1 FAD:protein FMN transferase [Parapedobacter sp. ISTM3]SKB89480.1 thiamine biosynthesis lipoprotein [Parapedobacter luteus]